MSYLLFDIGGTNTRVALSNDLKSFETPEKFKTPKKFDEGIEEIVKVAKELAPKGLEGVAGGIRGTLNHDNTELVMDYTLSDWIEKPILKTLEKKLNTKVLLENDAALCGLGEANFGAGKGHEIVVYHTVSTGVGGAKIENGKIDNSYYGFEPGRQIIDVDRTILGEDILPTLENLVSGTAVEERVGSKPYEIPQEDAIWDQLAFYLANGLRNSVMYWSPDIIVLGGSMVVGDPRIFLEDIKKHAETVIGVDMPVPEIVDAKLGDYGGLYGAMSLLSEQF